MIDQYRVPGRGDQGSHTYLYVSEPIEGKLHIIVPDVSIHVDIEDLRKLLNEKYPLKGARHAGSF